MTEIPASLDDLDADDPLPGEPWTELGYARRLIHVYGNRLRYVPAWRRWLVWDGQPWAHDATGQAQRWAKVIARRITTGAMAIEDEAKRKAAVSLARRGESSHAVAGALTLEGRVVTHILPIFHGEGGNGKGTLTGAVLAALGDYADAADPELLTARTFDAHPTGTADLFGLRLAVLHESDHGRRLAEGTVKRLTGGDRVKARRMREDFWHFEPSHTFLMLTNHKPVVGGTDEGIWRRLRLVPRDVVIPKDDRDEHLGDRLALELNAVLAWLAASYQDWRAHGLGDPDQVVKATASYRAESDALGRFLEQR